MFFLSTKNQYTFVSTKCKKVLLQYNQNIMDPISLDELKAAKCEPDKSDDIHEAQPSTSDEGNIDTQPSKRHPPPAMKPNVTKGNAKPSNKNK